MFRGMIVAMAVKVGHSKDKQPEEQSRGLIANLSRIRQFAAEVRHEFGKVVWPGKKQAIKSTAVVTALVILIAIYLGAVDWVLGSLVGAILR